MNIQRSTFNAQFPAAAPGRRPLGDWKLNVKCSVLVFFITLPLCAQPPTNDLPALLPAYGELAPGFWEQHHAVMIVTGFALLALAFLFLKLWLRPPLPPVLLPEMVLRQVNEAFAQLQTCPEDGKLLGEVSRLLRHYLCVAFGLPVIQMTTAEFSAVLISNNKIGPELAGIIADFLRSCDGRKFSPPGSTAPLNAVTSARELIVLVEQRRLANLSAPGAATLPARDAGAKLPPPFIPPPPPAGRSAP